MQDYDPLKDEPKEKLDDNSGVSRRDFLKISTISAAAVPILGTKVVQAAGEPVKVYGPGKVPVELTINGQKRTLQLEPRVTLLDALRDQLEITGAKRVCDRAECGACTVLMDNRTVYACSVLAIEAQGKRYHYDRVPDAGRRPPPRPAGVRRQRRFAMRFLHAWVRRSLQGGPRQEP